jgi:hypothetical protein
MLEGFMETIKDFVDRICDAAGCYTDSTRKTSKWPLKKNNTSNKKLMKLVAVVYECGNEFEIKIKDCLLDDECKNNRNVKSWGYGKGHGGTNTYGVCFRVKPDSVGQDYQGAVLCLKQALNNI